MVSLIFLLILSVVGFDYKRLSGPPETFKKHRIPSPLVGAMAFTSASIPLSVGDAKIFTETFAVDSTVGFLLGFFSPLSGQCKFDILFPNKSSVPNLESYRSIAEWPLSSAGDASAKGIVWDFSSVGVSGNYTLLIHQDDALQIGRRRKEPVQDVAPDSILLVRNNAREQIFSRVASYKWETGKKIGVVSQLTRDEEIRKGERPSVLRGDSVKVSNAYLDVIMPNTTRMIMPMFDNGENGDLEANDSVYGGLFNATETGLYKATAVLQGYVDGRPFVRSSSHLMMVVEDDVGMKEGREALLEFTNDHRAKIRVFVEGSSSPNTVYRVYGELYQESKPIHWIGGMTEKICGEKECYFELETDLRWFKMQGIKDVNGLAFHNFYISDKDSNVPLFEIDEIKIREERRKEFVSLIARLPVLSKATREMIYGRPPQSVLDKRKNKAMKKKGDVSLVALHGWCAHRNPWEAHSSQFDDTFYFNDFDQNRPTAKFAEMVVAQVANFSSFGMIGHSQGGFVATHIHNYFFTGLENSVGERKIQSLGTPYQGNSGAGSQADIIKIFGYGCGSSYDLSTDGAALWNSGIVDETRKDVYFYATQWEDAGLIKYCKLAVNVVLKWPNDGVTEVDYAPLEGGTFVDLTEGECHTTDMNYKPQYDDLERNTDINKLAAR